jgi:hypothetical protein
MPLAVLLLGTVLLISGWRGTYADIGSRFATDITGFLPWLAAVVAIGAIGYVPELQGFSNALLALVILVILLANQGVFAQWAQIAQSPPQTTAPTSFIPAQDQATLQQTPTIDLQTGSSSGSGSSGGSPLGPVGGIIGAIASWFG